MQEDQECQELRAKIRVLEAKRADEARHVRELENRLSDAESFVALRPKLQAKLSSQQTELIATRRELSDIQQLSQLAESRLLDSQEQLEMAMLDKEVAEERAEIAEADLEDLKEKLAIAEVELGVLQNGGWCTPGKLKYSNRNFQAAHRKVRHLRRIRWRTYSLKNRMNASKKLSYGLSHIACSSQALLN